MGARADTQLQREAGDDVVVIGFHDVDEVVVAQDPIQAQLLDPPGMEMLSWALMTLMGSARVFARPSGVSVISWM